MATYVKDRASPIDFTFAFATAILKIVPEPTMTNQAPLSLMNRLKKPIELSVSQSVSQSRTLTIQNPLICDCQLIEILDPALCNEPAHLKGRSISNVTRSDLNCSTQTDAPETQSTASSTTESSTLTASSTTESSK
ncbi:hypothetical protein DPMN_174966 [Dreissena polymorpha]|uniref:Uncharacterized protein n=1 Tax=Dreissena polymorpha TaxID=45954 RepID=A0A9D4E4A7_DREPO|nr:hypothetical protein DPMN_174966 [Dreissena polymorpha]